VCDFAAYNGSFRKRYFNNSEDSLKIMPKERRKRQERISFTCYVYIPVHVSLVVKVGFCTMHDKYNIKIVFSKSSRTFPVSVEAPSCIPLIKKRPNFLNSAPTSTESALPLLSARSVCVVKQLKCLCKIFTKFAAKFHTHVLFFKVFHCHFVTNPTNSLCTCSDHRM
jgi:hypothetical protein